MVWRSNQMTLPENRWVGENYYGYANPVVETSWAKMLGTVDAREREALLVQALTAMTADAVVNPTHLQPRAMAFREGLVGPRQPWQEEYALIWNAWEWHWQ
jgi:ABC-type oligopeptide transport system substrate-binding subunit